MTTFAPPTVGDLIESLVRTSNSLIVYELAARAAGEPTMTDGAWLALVEADHTINSVHDSITGYWDEPRSLGTEDSA